MRRHRPETSLLYQIVEAYWPEFQAELANHGKTLPTYVRSASSGCAVAAIVGCHADRVNKAVSQHSD